MHFDGPKPPDASYIILHTMVGSIASANARFQQAAQTASAHYGVGLDGRVVQWVKESDAAWHAGNFEINLDSIGIEHEDKGDFNGPRTPALYESSAQLVAAICKRYDIPCTRTYIRKHKEVSDAPTACPDSLNVDGIVRRAYAILHPPAPVVVPPPVPAPVPPKPPQPPPDAPVVVVPDPPPDPLPSVVVVPSAPTWGFWEWLRRLLGIQG